MPPLLLVPAAEVLLLAACAWLLPWNSPIWFTVSLKEAAISSPLSSLAAELEFGCPDTAANVS
jgi:hypothetical protein